MAGIVFPQIRVGYIDYPAHIINTSTRTYRSGTFDTICQDAISHNVNRKELAQRYFSSDSLLTEKCEQRHSELLETGSKVGCRHERDNSRPSYLLGADSE